MSDLIGLDGEPLRRKDTKRREMKSGQIKKTPWGDVLFKLTVDLPKDVPEENYLRYMVEYFNIGLEAFKSRLK